MSEGDDDPWIGKQLDRCLLERRLGRGGMGSVYRAYHTGLDIDVAVKILAPSFAAQPEWRERFLREARSAAKLDHPHVVRVLDVVAEERCCYLVMELVNGRSMRERLDASGPLPWSEVMRAGIQAADALAAAHARGLVHRDVKPDNLMVDASGAVKIADFGLARGEGKSELTQTGTISGTPAFMAPEQVDGGHIDGKADVYSLGLTLYALLSGDSPFRRPTLLATIAATTQAPLPALPPGLAPPALVELLARMCEKPPDRRPAMGEVLRVLKSAAAPARGAGPALRASAASPTRTAEPLRPASGAAAARPAARGARRTESGRAEASGRQRPVSRERPALPAPARSRVGPAIGVGAVALLGLVLLALRGEQPSASPEPAAPGPVAAAPGPTPQAEETEAQTRLDAWRARHLGQSAEERLVALDALMAAADAPLRRVAERERARLRELVAEEALGRRLAEHCRLAEYAEALDELARTRLDPAARAARQDQIESAVLEALAALESRFGGDADSARVEQARAALPVLPAAAWGQLDRARARRDALLAHLEGLPAPAPAPESPPDPGPVQPEPPAPPPTPPAEPDAQARRLALVLEGTPFDPPHFARAREALNRLRADAELGPLAAGSRDPLWTELLCAAEFGEALEASLRDEIGVALSLRLRDGQQLRGTLRSIEGGVLGLEQTRSTGGATATTLRKLGLHELSWPALGERVLKRVGERGPLVVGVVSRMMGELAYAQQQLARVAGTPALEYARVRGFDLSGSLDEAGLAVDPRRVDALSSQARRQRLIVEGHLVAPAQFAAGLTRAAELRCPEPLRAIVPLADGAQALAGGASGALYLVDFAGTGGITQVRAGAGEPVSGLASDGRQLAFAAVGTQLLRFQHGRARPLSGDFGRIQAVSVSPDGAWLAVAAERSGVFALAGEALGPRIALEVAELRCLRWDGRGELLHGGTANGTVVRWKLSQGSLRAAPSVRTAASIQAIAGDADREVVLAIAGGELHRWSTKSRAEAPTSLPLGGAAPSAALSLHPSGLLAAALMEDGTLAVFATQPLRELARFTAHPGAAGQCELSFGWAGVVSAGGDGRVATWRARAFAAEGEAALPAGSQRLRPAVWAAGLAPRWSLPLGSPLRKLDGPPAEDWVAVGCEDGTVALVGADGRLGRRTPPVMKAGDFVQALAVHPVSGAVLAASKTEGARVMQLEPGGWREVFRNPEAVGGLAFDRDANRLAIGEYWWTLTVADSAGVPLARTRGKEEGFLFDPPNYIRPVWLAHRADHLLVRDFIGRLELYRFVPPGTLQRVWTAEKTTPVTGICADPAGRWAAAGRFTGFLDVFAGDTGRALFGARLSSGDHDVVCVATDGEGQVVFAGSAAGVLHAWDPAGWRTLPALSVSDKPLRALRATRLGVYAAGDDGVLRLLAPEPLARAP